ncbi:MAG: hypothetical protein PHV34_21395 [Verrucomicrobiae bacterium]|nr:hypothetical protein [Verrucomicrobiae bacterium]
MSSNTVIPAPGGRPQILQPDQIELWSELKAYYHQRLGRNFQRPPAVYLSLDEFRGLLEYRGNLPGLYARMLLENARAAREFFTVYETGRRARVVMAFNLESASPGLYALPFIRRHMQTPLEKDWFVRMRNNAAVIQRLHRLWRNAW